jgi:murein DD-endopeptidase MepM/ murein hydrolase activator NlpD
MPLGTTRRRSPRLAVGAAILVLGALPGLEAGPAVGAESASDLQTRMHDIQAQLDATAAKVDAADARAESVQGDLDSVRSELSLVSKRTDRLRQVAETRARALYEQGNSTMLEVLFDGASDVSDLATRAEMLSRVSLSGADDFVALARSQERLDALVGELKAKNAELTDAQYSLKSESEHLQAQLDAVSAEYTKLQQKLGAAAPAATGSVAPSASAQVPTHGGMYCPVGGPVSFTDTYGAPRSGGRSHEGVDMMAAYGTPEIAITSGTITYAGYSDLGGNVLYLSGDDGNLYIYIHSATQLTGGHVNAGDQVGTVGDTGNAEGIPHLHFEYHPGGGGSVDPTPLAASVC